jgi:hypothetical protein
MCPEDDVIDYMIMEAVSLRVRKAEEDAAKQQKRNEFKKDFDNLRKYAG